MIKNYIKIAWRHFIKNLKYSAIKVGGFALGIAACLLILMYVLHEKSYDKSYPDYARIYRIVGESASQDGSMTKGTAFPAPMAKALAEAFPEIEIAGRLLPNLLFGAGGNQVSTEKDHTLLYEKGFTFADQEMLDMLAPKMVYGKIQDALSAPMTVVLSRSKAEKFFPGINPIGQQIFLNNNREVGITVSAVIEDIPRNSHLHGLDYFLSLKDAHFYDGESTNWMASNYVVYVKLKKNASITDLENRMRNLIVEDYILPSLKAAGRTISPQVQSSKLHLQPIQAIHLESYDILDYKAFTDNRGDKRIVWLFTCTALFILGIAAVNYINLSIARSNNRGKEIGLRKIVGSSKKSIVSQFLIESICYSFMAVLLAFLLAWLTLPLFNRISGQTLAYSYEILWLVPIAIIAALTIGLISGIYPALVLSSFKPIRILKGANMISNRFPMLRNGLVVFQFVVSILLIIATLIINNQSDFILNRQVGFDRDQVLVLEGTNSLGDQIKTFKNELKQSSHIKQVSISEFIPVHMAAAKRNGNPIWLDGRKESDQPTQSQLWEIDEDYLETMGIRLIEGRNFREDIATDQESVIINEKLVADLGLSTPIGAKIMNDWRTFTVIGVVANFDFESIQDEPTGGVMLSHGNSPNMMSVKLSGDNIPLAIDELQNVWKKFAPQQTLRYSFLDDQFANIYANIKRTGEIFSIFATLAIFIACIGLFGLAAFTTEQRTKEIGVRKVLGASVSGIVRLLSKDFVKLVLIAIIIASPIAWWAMNKWLEDFAYRIDIQWWMFAFAGLVALVIALITVSGQAIRAAIANPVKSLRNE